MNKILKKTILFFLILMVALLAAIFGISQYMMKTTENQIVYQVASHENSISQDVMETLKAESPDCIMVLGAQVKPDGSPSYMLKDRLDIGIKLYKEGVAPKLLLTGDHGQSQYDEVNTMKQYALDAGVSKEDLFLDHAGFSTYDSVYRAKAIFQVNKMVTVTQGYHQYRTLYGCNKMGIEAWGVATDQKTYRGQDKRDLREIAARDKDFVKWMFKPEPTYLGDTIPISGSGIESQD